MTQTHNQGTPRRHIDVASVALALVGVLSGILAYWLITTTGADPLILVPAVVAATLGVTHAIKTEAPRPEQKDETTAQQELRVGCVQCSVHVGSATPPPKEPHTP